MSLKALSNFQRTHHVVPDTFEFSKKHYILREAPGILAESNIKQSVQKSVIVNLDSVLK